MTEYKMSEIFEGVKNVICDSLEVPNKGFGLSASLMDELGAESLDYLDIMFRLEKKFQVKIERGRIEKDLQRAFPSMNIKQNTGVTPEIADVLKSSMPEIAPARIDSLQKIKELPGTFTVATFVRFTVRALLEADPATRVTHDLGAGYAPEQLGLSA